MTAKQLLNKIKSSFFKDNRKQVKKPKKDTSLEESERFLSQIDHDSAYMRERKDNRFLQMLCVLLFAVLIIFVGNNSELSEKLQVKIPAPLLEVNIDNETKEYTYKPLDQAHKSIEEMTRDYVKEYVLMREIFIPEEDLMLKRWDQYTELYWRTDRKFWAKNTAPTLTKKLNKLMKQRRQRDVVLSEPVDFGDGWWQVEATFLDSIRHKKFAPVEVTIFLRGKFQDLEMPTKHAHHNRIGWTVDKYSVTVQKGSLENE